MKNHFFDAIPLQLIIAVVCGILLFLGFPPFDHFILPWITIFPLLVIISGKRLVYSFFVTFTCGISFFFGLFNWILEVSGYTFIHHSILAIYLSTYFGFFGLIYSIATKYLGEIAGLFIAPFIWVIIEYIRSNFFFLALPWGLLAHSQHKFPLIMQIASLTGVYGVSFLIVLANAAIAAVLLLFSPMQNETISVDFKSKLFQGRVKFVLGAIVCVSLALIYGDSILSAPNRGSEVKLALVQGNIEQMKKWDRKYASFIMRTYKQLTIEASKSNPDLIVWPETATPVSINRDIMLYNSLKYIAKKAGTFLLLGSSQQQKFDNGKSEDPKYYNSAFLIPPGKNRGKPQRYDKIRLFPFGEYLPMREIFPWSIIDVSNITGYQAGNEFAVFKLNGYRFATTICWENMFPDMVRRFVNNGAQFIINITNEAWFGETAAPYQFLSMNVFRAVENRVYVVRCANTGISCIIDPYGRVIDRVKDKNGKDTFVRGTLTGTVVPLDSNTFYTRYGDWLVWLSIAFSAGILLISFIRKYRSANQQFIKGHQEVK